MASNLKTRIEALERTRAQQASIELPPAVQIEYLDADDGHPVGEPEAGETINPLDWRLKRRQVAG